MKFRQETVIPEKVEVAEYELCDVSFTVSFATGLHKVGGVPNRNEVVVTITPPGCKPRVVIHAVGSPLYEFLVSEVLAAQAADSRVTARPVADEAEAAEVEAGEFK